MRKKLVAVVTAVLVFAISVLPAFAEGTTDPAVQKAYDAYTALKDVLEHPSPDVVDDLEDLIEAFTDANEDLTDAQLEELVALTGEADVFALISTALDVSFIATTAQAYDDYKATPNAQTAYDFMDLYDSMTEMGIDMAGYIPDIATVAAAAKADLPSDGVIKVYDTILELAAAIIFPDEDTLSDALSKWDAVADTFYALSEDELNDLAVFLEVADGAAAKAEVRTAVTETNAMYSIVHAYNVFADEEDYASAEAFVTVYDEIFSEESPYSEDFKDLVRECYTDLDDTYAAAKALCDAGDQGADNATQTSPKTADSMAVPMTVVVLAAVAGVAAVSRRRAAHI